MDDDDFEDLFGEVDLLQDSSQRSLIDPYADDNLADTEDTSTSTAHADILRRRDGMTSEAADGDEYLLGSLPRPAKFSTDINFPTRASARLDRNYPNADVIDKIEAVLEPMVDALLNEKSQISLTLRTRNRSSNGGTKQLCFPGKTADEAWRFAVVLRILNLMHEALRNDAVYSKRDIYYRDPALFGTQSIVDRYVDDIALTFGLQRSALNIAAVAKGLIAGAVTFSRTDASRVEAFNDRQGMLVPSLKDIMSANMQSVRWILVIEKEASFRSIAASAFWERISTEGIVITGKGYPDLSTRAMLHFLATPSPRNGFASPSVFGLADFDPDGIAILSTYKHGSKALAHEKKEHAVPQLRWIGLRSEHLETAQGHAHAPQGMLKLTPRDRKKAIDMLGELLLSNSEDASRTRLELQRMIQLNVKAELQLLDVMSGEMDKLLRSALCTSGDTATRSTGGLPSASTMYKADDLFVQKSDQSPPKEPASFS